MAIERTLRLKAQFVGRQEVDLLLHFAAAMKKTLRLKAYFVGDGIGKLRQELPLVPQKQRELLTVLLGINWLMCQHTL